MAPIDQYQSEGDEPRRGGGVIAALLGGAVVAAAGVALGYAVLNKLNEPPAQPPDDQQVSIVVDKAKPLPIPKSGAPMEVLGPGMAEAALPPPPVVADDPLPEGAASPDSALPASGPHFDCSKALSRAQEMICSDPDLAAMDRRMARAYAEAGAAGMPAARLRADQAEWRTAREDAAAHSPDAVAEVYELRIRELEDFADAAARR